MDTVRDTKRPCGSSVRAAIGAVIQWRVQTRVVAMLALGALTVGCGSGSENQATAGEATMDRQSERPEIEHIYPEGVARLPVFTPAVRVGDMLYLSGSLGAVPGELRLIEGGIGPETRQTMENIREILAAAGATLEDIVKCTVFLTSMDDYAAMNEVYLEYFPNNPPARSAMAGSGLALGARVEIECIAVAP